MASELLQFTPVFELLGPTFIELIVTPFRHAEMVWGIVPLYFGWLANEMNSNKASYRTAIQTGFSFIWAGAHWSYKYLTANPNAAKDFNLKIFLAVNVTVTVLALVLGVVALASGLRKKFPKYGRFLGHTRFSNYFMITIFPMQSGYLNWSWERIVAIVIFAVPLWMLLHFMLKPLRR